MATSNLTTYSIYRIVCFPTGKCYVGKTCDFKKRKYEHMVALRRGNHHSIKLQRAYAKYGESSFYFEIIERGLTQDNAFEREVEWVKGFNSQRNGFNITPGGDRVNPVEKPCVWNGIQYKSVTSAAIANGFTQKNLSRYFSKGFTKTSDIRGRTAKPIIFAGIYYPSLKAAADAYGVTPSAICVRMKNGNTDNTEFRRFNKPYSKKG